jgi:hypothetical protein
MEPEERKRGQMTDEELDKLYDKKVRKLYHHIFIYERYAFERGEPLHRFLGTCLMEKLINHFEEKEEYEKCKFLFNLNIKLKLLESFYDLRA